MISGIEMARPEREEEGQIPRHGRDGEDVVETHHGVGDGDGPDRVPEPIAQLDVVLLVVVGEKLHGDPEQQATADDLEVGRRQSARAQRRRS